MSTALINAHVLLEAARLQMNWNRFQGAAITLESAAHALEMGNEDGMSAEAKAIGRDVMSEPDRSFESQRELYTRVGKIIARMPKLPERLTCERPDPKPAAPPVTDARVLEIVKAEIGAFRDAAIKTLVDAESNLRHAIAVLEQQDFGETETARRSRAIADVYRKTAEAFGDIPF